MARSQDGHLWALAEDLAGLDAGQWRHETLCGGWNVEQVVAHLIAAASLNQRQWLRSMLAARFRVPYLAELDGPGVPTLRSRLRA